MNDKKVKPEQRLKNVIDWDEIHQRLAAVEQIIKRGGALTPADQKKILKKRAIALAQEPEGEKDETDSIEVVEFRLAYEKYAIESEYVREVWTMREFTPLPHTPPFILGIINIRGEIISVIDIKKLLGLPEKGLAEFNKVLVIYNDLMEFGLLADDVSNVRSIKLKEIQSSLPTLTEIRKDILKGITNDRVVILDAQKLLADKTILMQQKSET